MHHGGLTQVMGAPRRRHGAGQQTGLRVEGDEQVGGREAAAFGLVAGLAELLTQFLGVRHGEAGAVEEENAVTAPARGLGLGLGAARGGDGALEAVEEGDGEPLAGLAVGGIGEGESAEMREVADGGIAVEDLLEEEVGGDDGGQGPRAAVEFEVATDGVEEGFGDSLGGVALDAREGLGPSKHGSLVVVMESMQPHHGRRLPPFPA